MSAEGIDKFSKVLRHIQMTCGELIKMGAKELKDNHESAMQDIKLGRLCEIMNAAVEKKFLRLTTRRRLSYAKERKQIIAELRAEAKIP